MIRWIDENNGLPLRIYREPSEIRRDIREISIKIEAAKDMLNIRSLLMDIIAREGEGNPKSLILELEDTISEAKEAERELENLDLELDSLREELMEVREQLAR